ncbi:MAG: hypothetical protein CM15mP92_2720 [Halieaceae bacterium]|nr:MAG: hypothetical protein CM15mP92_2720 [Halieaceae bacterium]
MQEIYRCAGALLYFSALATLDADWVLRGGKVYSMDATASHYSALAIEGNRLVWMGDSDAAASYIGPDTRLIELDGRVVFPGFIDTHIHSMDTLPLINGVKLSPYQSAEEVLAAIAEHARTHPYQNRCLGRVFGTCLRRFGADGSPARCELSLIGLH